MSQTPAETTGNPAVDEVLASMATLDEQPLAEHAQLFEQAHERLRGALADASDGSTGPA